MLSRRDVIGRLAVASVGVVLSGCSLVYPSATLRYRLTVEIDTPQGVRAGSSVIEIRRIEKGSFGDSPMIGGHTKAEAVAVDLPGGATVFALLRNDRLGVDYPVNVLSNALRYPKVAAAMGNAGKGTLVTLMKAANRTRPGVTLLPVDYPLLVTFPDIRDPKTVARVDPDDLAASFGPGVKLRRITVQVTDDPVTTGIEKRLPLPFWRKWSVMHQAQMARDEGAMNNPYFKSLAGQLSRNDFITETAR